MTTETKVPPAPNQNSPQLAARADMSVLAPIGMTERMGPLAFMPRTFSEVAELSKLMATSGIAVRKHLRNNPGACLRVALQALRWRMDPFAVASKSYEVNQELAFEAQLVNAVVNTSEVLNGRLDINWEGEGEALHCTVVGYVKGDDRPKKVSQSLQPIRVRNSPLWKDAPRQQLAYYTTRMWARLYTPEVLLGVYTPDEVGELMEVKNTPATILPPERPKRADYEFAGTLSEQGEIETPAKAAESPKDEPEEDLAGQPIIEPIDPPSPESLPSWEVVDSDGEFHPHPRPELAADYLVRIFSSCRSLKAIDGLIDSNLTVISRLPEDLEKTVNEAIASRQDILSKRGS